MRVAIVGTGTASSDDVEIELSADAEAVLCTAGRGFKSLITLPLVLPAAISAQRQGRRGKSPYYRRPWIVLKVERLG